MYNIWKTSFFKISLKSL